jgi:hypothetical protein
LSLAHLAQARRFDPAAWFVSAGDGPRSTITAEANNNTKKNEEQ